MGLAATIVLVAPSPPVAAQAIGARAAPALSAQARPAGSRAAISQPVAAERTASTTASITSATSAPASVMVVFDASGSMWGPLTGAREPRFEQAREALRASLARHAQAQRVGVVTFGGTRRDCTDGLVTAPLQPFDAATSLSPLTRLNPRGKGPLVMGLEAAAAALADAPGPKAIVVVHDGPDNCRRDACAAATTLAQSHPGLVVHTVGVALDAEDATALACLSRASGGTQRNAASHDELNAAIEAVTTLALNRATAPTPQPASARRPGGAPSMASPTSAVSAAPAAAAPVPGITYAPGAHRLSLAALVSTQGPMADAGLTWLVTPLDATAATAGQVAHLKTAPPIPPAETIAATRRETVAHPVLMLKPGRYRIDVEAGLVRRSLLVEIKPDQDATAIIDLDAGLLHASVGLDDDPASPASDATMTLLRSEPTEASPAERIVYAGSVPPAALLVPAGNYELQARAGDLQVVKTLSVKAGHETRAALALRAGVIEARVGGLQPGAAPLITVEADRPAGGTRSPDSAGIGEPAATELARIAASPARFVLPPGTYRVIARHQHLMVQRVVTLAAGERLATALDLTASRVNIRLTLGGKAIALPEVSLVVTPRGQSDNPAPNPLVPQPFDASGQARVTVAAGRYRLEATMPGSPVSAATEIDVAPGSTQTTSLELAAAVIRLGDTTPGAAANQARLARVWEIRSAGGDLVWRAMDLGGPATRVANGASNRFGRIDRQVAVLPAGTYTVRRIVDQRVSERVVTVRPGQSLDVDLVD